MGGKKYLHIEIDDMEIDADVSAEFPVKIDYQLEDLQDFQKKKSSEALNIKLPPTTVNDRAFNTFGNPSFDDLSPDNLFRGARKFLMQAYGDELMVGKTFLNHAKKQHGRIKEYEISAWGNNADWMIDMKETTLYELLKHISFVFDTTTVVGTWSFNGTNEAIPYVFAPVRYGDYMDPVLRNDNNYSLLSMKPSISKYWIIYWAFKALGYQVKSNFLDSNYYRRMVMPWTWGAFLSSEGTKYETHMFLAKGTESKFENGSQSGYWDLEASNDSTLGGFDNNEVNHPGIGDYEYFPENDCEMRWTYRTPHYGTLEAHFSATLDIDAGCNGSTSELHLKVEWFKNGVLAETTTVSHLDGPLAGGISEVGLIPVFFSSIVDPDDTISARVHLYMFEAKIGYASCRAMLMEFKLDFFKIPVGGTISFDSYLGFQKYKFLDFLRGECDLHNLSIQTDSINKVVVIEPTHAYPVANDFATKQPGYFIDDYVDWTAKVDETKESTVELFNEYERELLFRFKEDTSDGAFKTVRDRHLAPMANGKYTFPDRFKSGKREFENRFFSATMHYDVAAFRDITGVAPQMICLVPENISNTSSGEAGNTFMPRSAYYKGLVEGVGGWKFDMAEFTNYPYMFAVNYKPGGENDPIISYSDEKIGNEGSYVLGKGLIKRFFWPRLAIMRNGQYLTENLMLNNKDIVNWFHRERIRLDGNLYELMGIKAYDPLNDDSTQCNLRRYVPVSHKDLQATYPTQSSVLTDTVDGSSFDMKYNRLMCLSTDIPQPTE